MGSQYCFYNDVFTLQDAVMMSQGSCSSLETGFQLAEIWKYVFDP